MSSQSSVIPAPLAPNSIPELAARIQSGHLTWLSPLLMTFIRLPLILLGHFLFLGYFTAIGQANPWASAVSLTNFYFPIVVDLSCLLLLARFTRREGMKLGNLIRFDRRRLQRDVLMGVGLFLLFLVLFWATSLVGGLVVYGSNLFSETGQSQTNSSFIQPPLWVLWWSTLVLPLSSGIVEEMAYRGYALPRLVALTQRTWLAVLIMSLGFGMQHLALPLVSWQISLSRFISTFLLAPVFALIYLKQQRLLPLIIAHWGINFVGLGLLPLLWKLSSD